MEQYTRLMHRIVNEGKWKTVGRNGAEALTVISDHFKYDCRDGKIEIPTTAEVRWDMAIAELLGYIRGERDAGKFRLLGTKSWDKNANVNEAWLDNPNRLGTDDMGIVYGNVGNNWPKLDAPNGELAKEGVLAVSAQGIDLLDKIYQNLCNGIDDRGEIWTFWNPGLFQFGCLRPCLYEHQFSLLDGELYIDSTQRSVDGPLGLKWNMVQVQVLLQVMAQITGTTPAFGGHKLVNCHIYDNQLETYKTEQMPREDLPQKAVLKINPDIKTLEDLRTWVTVKDFEIEGYESHPHVKYIMTE